MDREEGKQPDSSKSNDAGTSSNEPAAEEDPQEVFRRTLAQLEQGNIKVNQLPDEESLKKPGNRDGQTKLVRSGQKVVAYSWNQATGEWVNLGDVVGAAEDSKQTNGEKPKKSNKIPFEGKEYDFLFDVDVADDQPTLKLPYNMGDNPWDVAQQFLIKYQLPQSYLQQVVDFIIENTPKTGHEKLSGASDPFTGASRYVPGSRPVNTVTSFFPQNTHLFFDKTNVEGIAKKLKEFHEHIPPESRLNAEDTKLLLRLGDTTKEVEKEQIGLIKMLLSWPTNYIFPALDLIRAGLLKSQINEELSTSKDSSRLMDTLLVCATDANSQPNQMLALRALCNLFSSPGGEVLVVTHASTVFKALTGSPVPANKNVQIAQSTLYLNYAVSFFKNIHDDAMKFDCLTATFTMLKPNLDPEAQFRLMVAIGTLLQNDDNILQLLNSEDVVKILSSLSTIKDPIKLGNCAEQLLKIIK